MSVLSGFDWINFRSLDSIHIQFEIQFEIKFERFCKIG
jgi:hypothetical protein